MNYLKINKENYPTDNSIKKKKEKKYVQNHTHTKTNPKLYIEPQKTLNSQRNP